MAILTRTSLNPLNRKLQLYSIIPANPSSSAEEDYIVIAARMTRAFLLLCFILLTFFFSSETTYLSSDTSCHKQLTCKCLLSLNPSASLNFILFTKQNKLLTTAFIICFSLQIFHAVYKLYHKGFPNQVTTRLKD